jgi:two-component system, chemotaxis family, chemotaxis protein CheY
LVVDVQAGGLCEAAPVAQARLSGACFTRGALLDLRSFRRWQVVRPLVAARHMASWPLCAPRGQWRRRDPDGWLMARILVVDDAAFMRKVLRDMLLAGGHEVVGEATNGIEAVERYQELRPELITLDITMPQKDGLTALKEIMMIDPRARVVICSSLGSESKVIESIKLGAKDFIAKPLCSDRLLEAVQNALA